MRGSSAPRRASADAVRLARGDAVAELVRRRRHVGSRRRRRARPCRFRDGGDQLLHGVAATGWYCASSALHRRIRLLALLERLAVPRVLVFDGRDAVALERSRQDHRRTPGDRARLGVGIEQRVDVVAVDDDGVPAERAPLRRVRLHVVLPHRRAALAEPIDVGDAHQVVERVERRRFGRFPDGSFGRFAVAEQHVGAVARSRSAARSSAIPTPAQRPCPSEPVATSTNGRRGVGMPFEVGAELAQLQQLVRGNRPTAAHAA